MTKKLARTMSAKPATVFMLRLHVTTTIPAPPTPAIMETAFIPTLFAMTIIHALTTIAQTAIVSQLRRIAMTITIALLMNVSPETVQTHPFQIAATCVLTSIATTMMPVREMFA